MKAFLPDGNLFRENGLLGRIRLVPFELFGLCSTRIHAVTYSVDFASGSESNSGF
jgi:hypothetical protein